MRDRRTFGADRLARQNYATGSGNLEARAAIWTYAVPTPGNAPRALDWFCDLVEWDGVRLAADVGCGSGRYLPALLARAARVLALDLSPAMLAEVRTRASAAVNADVCHLPLRDGVVDTALAAWMLYHAADPAMACAELRRVVRPGGALIAVTNAAAHTAELDEVYGEAIGALTGKAPAVGLPASGFTLDEAAATLSRAFSEVTIHLRRVLVRVPAVEPVVAYLGSLRQYIDRALAPTGASFDDLVPHVEAAAQRRIARVGAVEVTGLPAALVCR